VRRGSLQSGELGVVRKVGWRGRVEVLLRFWWTRGL